MNCECEGRHWDKDEEPGNDELRRPPSCPQIEWVAAIWRISDKLNVNKDYTHFVPETRIPSPKLSLQPSLHTQPHITPEFRRGCRPNARITLTRFIQVKVDRWSPSDVGVASRSKLLDVGLRMKGEESSGKARWLISTLHA